LGPEHPRLQAAAVAVHCATQAPDNPQFCEQEKLLESQLATHSAIVRDCARRMLAAEASAAAVPDKTNAASAISLIGLGSGMRVQRLHDRRDGCLVYNSWLRIGSRLDHAIMSRYLVGVRRHPRHEREQFGTKAVAAGYSGGMKAQKRRHVCDLLLISASCANHDPGEWSEHSVSCSQIGIAAGRSG
jgi:hypothetical protein